MDTIIVNVYFYNIFCLQHISDTKGDTTDLLALRTYRAYAEHMIKLSFENN